MDVKRGAKITGWLILLFALAGVCSCAAFFLPSTEKVRLAGTEIKRLDAKDGTPLHDVRYIQAQKIDGSSLVFRNEDTRWGFPFYFKFDSADLAGEAQNIVKSQPEAVILVTYYGFRSQVLDLYPNIVSLKAVDSAYVHVPIFNIVFCLVVFGLIIFVFVKMRRTIGRTQAWWASRSPPPQS
jgi:amino acid transporter